MLSRPIITASIESWSLGLGDVATVKAGFMNTLWFVLLKKFLVLVI